MHQKKNHIPPPPKKQKIIGVVISVNKSYSFTI